MIRRTQIKIRVVLRVMMMMMMMIDDDDDDDDDDDNNNDEDKSEPYSGLTYIVLVIFVY